MLESSSGSGVCVNPPAPAGSLSGGKLIKAVPNLVNIGDTSSVSWGVTNVTASSCSVSGSNGDSWSGGSGTTFSGSHVSSEIEERTVYTLHCSGLDGSTVNSTAVVNIVPLFNEI